MSALQAFFTHCTLKSLKILPLNSTKNVKIKANFKKNKIK